MRIDFDRSLRTGIETVDEQHKALIELYNELDEAVWKGQAHRQMEANLARLFKYTKQHFKSEEAMLAESGYPQLEQHQLEHQRLTDQLRQFVLRYKRSKERFSAEMLEFVRLWITSHIKESDLAYVPHVERYARLLASAARPDAVAR